MNQKGEKIAKQNFHNFREKSPNKWDLLKFEQVARQFQIVKFTGRKYRTLQNMNINLKRKKR